MNLSKPIREYLIFTDPKVSAALVELNKKRHEDETLKAVLEERRKVRSRPKVLFFNNLLEDFRGTEANTKKPKKCTAKNYISTQIF